MSEIKVDSQTDYSKKATLKPHYRMTKITPREGSGNVSITTAGGQESHFDIPQRAINLSKSVLSFTTAPAASGGGVYNYCFMDCLAPIRQIQLQTRNGVMLCDVNNVNVVTKMIWKPETKLEDFMALECHGGGVGAGSYLQRCNANNQLYFSQVAAEYKAAFVDDAGDTPTLAARLTAAIKRPSAEARRWDDAAIAAGTGNVSAVNVGFIESKYMTVGTANAANPVVSVKINLGMLYNTIFELDKTLLFDEIITMKIIWAPSTRIYTEGTDPLSPSAAAAAATDTVTVSSLSLFVATEQRQEIIQGLMSKIKSGGLEVLIPYTHVYKQNLASASQNITLRFDRGHGRRLQRVYHALFHNVESSVTAYNNDNRADAKCVSFYTTLDSQRQQDFNVTNASFEDYMLLKQKLKGSAVLNSDVYKYNWVWVDDYTGDQPLWEKDLNTVAGLDLSIERRWEFIGTTVAANHNHYTVAVVQKMLKISDMGVELS